MEQRSNHITNFLMLVLYRASLDLVFTKMVVPHYFLSYLNIDISTEQAIISWAILLPVAFVINRLLDRRGVSDVFLLLLLWVNYIPATVFYMYTGSSYFGFTTLFYTVMVLTNAFMATIHVGSNSLGSINVLRAVSLLLAGVPVFVWVVYAHMHIQLSISEGIYTLRGLSNSFNLPTWLLYPYKMSISVLPILFIYYARRKDYLYAVIMLFAEISIFFTDGSRIVVLYVAFAIGFMLLGNKFDLLRIVRFTPALLGALCLVSCLFSFEDYSTDIIGNLINRAFFMPQQIAELYYLYFDANGFDWYTSSFLHHFGFGPRYPLTLPKTIGYEFFGFYYGENITNANMGLYADAYANMGVLGIIVVGFLTMLVIKVLETLSVNHDSAVVLVLALIFVPKIISDSLFTILLSGGLALAAFVLMLMSTQEDSNCSFVVAGKAAAAKTV